MTVYEPTLESLRRHPVPDWYHDAKLGIFMHWSLSSVPAFAPRDFDINELLRERYHDMQALSPYSEWYENSLRFPWTPVAKHHRETYGDKPYEEFRHAYERAIETWDPEVFADIVASSGAHYFVLVTKHHDGYCLWPTRVPNPRRPGWNSRRDIVGELAAAVRRRGIRFGVYYSGGLDWRFEPLAQRTILDALAGIPGGDYPAYAEAQVRELIERYEPSVLWNDIAWPTDEATLFRLFADYYAAVPEGVVNDRWITPGWQIKMLRLRPVRRLADRLLHRAIVRAKEPASLQPPAPPHYDARTPEYTVFPTARREKWECVRGIDKSFGFNRLSRPEDHLSRTELLTSLADITAKNGNLLLNVGPRGDATIPDVQAERLRWLGAFLGRQGEAIQRTRPWVQAAGRTDAGFDVRYTSRDERVYALILGRPAPGEIAFEGIRAGEAATATWLGRDTREAVALGRRDDARLVVWAPADLDDSPVHALALDGVEAADEHRGRVPDPGSARAFPGSSGRV